MGSYISAICPCGFSAQCRLGGGMLSHHKDSRVPYLCETCGIVSVNVMAEKLVCPRRESHSIHPYASSSKDRRAAAKMEKQNFDEEMRLLRRLIRLILRQSDPEMAPKPDSVANWGDFEILDRFYRCPSCKGETMKFRPTGKHFD